ncbi:MAG: hypothetical protein U9O64_09540 [Campylobacterota bacterium]|nr:hypothetical protein [Campylobacterota bacterium]
MNVFNYNLIFRDEPSLNGEDNPKQLEDIYIMQNSRQSSLEVFHHRSDWIEMNGHQIRYSTYKREGGHFSWSMEIENTLILLWESEQRNIFYQKYEKYSSDKLCYWVLHTFFPLVLEVEESLPILHVSSVEIEGKVVLFSACSNGGKSTLASYFMQQGHSLYSDDILAIQKRGEAYDAIASYPFHRPYRKPETLGVYINNFASNPKPIHAIYYLERAAVSAKVEPIELFGIEKFKALHKSIFFHFSDLKEEHFFFFTQMAQHVPMYKIMIPFEKKRLGDVYDVIVSR